jgi:hypothetical protein
MNQKKNFKKSDSICSIDTVNTNLSLDTSILNLSDTLTRKNKVTIDPKIEIINVKKFKKFNLRNSISSKDIFNNIQIEKKRRLKEKMEKEEEERKKANCGICSIF